MIWCVCVCMRVVCRAIVCCALRYLEQPSIMSTHRGHRTPSGQGAGNGPQEGDGTCPFEDPDYTNRRSARPAAKELFWSMANGKALTSTDTRRRRIQRHCLHCRSGLLDYYTLSLRSPCSPAALAPAASLRAKQRGRWPSYVAVSMCFWL